MGNMWPDTSTAEKDLGVVDHKPICISKVMQMQNKLTKTYVFKSRHGK